MVNTLKIIFKNYGRFSGAGAGARAGARAGADSRKKKLPEPP